MGRRFEQLAAGAGRPRRIGRPATVMGIVASEPTVLARADLLDRIAFFVVKVFARNCEEL